MDDTVWTQNPFQLFDFILIGEQHVTLTKVTNAIARIGLGVALIMALLGQKSWWIAGLAILFISMLFHHTSLYAGCYDSTPVVAYVEGFESTDTLASPMLHSGPAPYEPSPSNNRDQIEFIETPRFQPSMTEVRSTAAQVPSRTDTEDLTLGQVMRRVHDQVEQETQAFRDSEDQEHQRHLQLNLTPDDFSTCFFEPYTIYQPNEALYATGMA